MNDASHLGGHCGITHTDSGALKYLVSRFGVRSMLDIGCGVGGMRGVAAAAGVKWAGIDGIVEPGPDTIRHDFCDGPCNQMGRYDLAWSVEFLEHVSENYQQNYMLAIQRCAYAFVTAAPPGKTGHHHVNCKDAVYWIDVFRRHGFRLMLEETIEARSESTMRREFAKDFGLVFVSDGA